MDQAKNFAKGTLSTGYDDDDTSIVLTAGDGAKFPTAPFNAVWWNATDYADPADDPFVEVIRVTGKSTDTFTVTRGEEGTGAAGVGSMHNTEGKVYRLIAPLTAKVINDDMLSVGIDGINKVVTEDDLIINCGGGKLILLGPVGTDQYQSASGPVGSVVSKIAIADENGDFIGYIPVYSTIT